MLLPGDIGATIRHNTQKYTYHTKYHTTLKQNTAHKATQTIKDTLHTMNTTQRNNEYNSIRIIVTTDDSETTVGISIHRRILLP
jgi:hypothetical protein